MLRKHESLTGKLLLTTALVAVTVGFGWQQHDQISRQQAAVLAAMQVPTAVRPQIAAAVPQTTTPAVTAPAADPASAPPVNSTPKSNHLAMAASATPAAPQDTTPGYTALLPATAPPPPPPMALTGMDAIHAFIPTEGVSPPLPPVTGTPDPGAAAPIPAGSHLEDGEYQSDKIAFEWGDLRVRVVVTGGKMTTVQVMSYPDHRSQSLYLIQLADPILTSEVIKTQQANVNVVSSATNTSIAFQDAIASVLTKATR